VLSLDAVRMCLASLRAQRLRSALSMLGVGIGVAAVVLLTSIGEGTRLYVMEQFTQFGTNILQISPGRTETFGLPGVMGGTTHKLTLEDAESLRRVRDVRQVLPVAMGKARVERGGRGRDVYVFGVTADAPEVWRFGVSRGRFLPAGDPRRGGAEVVLGPTVERELFPTGGAIGGRLRAAGRRLRVVGVMESKGQLLGFDIDDAVYVPVATALAMFDLEELAEIDVTFAHEDLADEVARGVSATLAERHGGKVDFTVLTQAEMLSVFDDVMAVLTLAVGGLGGISLVVGAIGILTMMWIAVGERTGEIGLLRALGATRGQVLALFLLEAAALAVVGGLAGLGAGAGVAALLRELLPGLPVELAPAFVVAALAVSLATGLVAGVGPARRAAGLDPIDALREE
jgi:putative ABC transport system permease protein